MAKVNKDAVPQKIYDLIIKLRAALKEEEQKQYSNAGKQVLDEVLTSIQKPTRKQQFEEDITNMRKQRALKHLKTRNL
ncbi:MAG: hypothetical protein QM668_15035 [Agriterribacter sp.]